MIFAFAQAARHGNSGVLIAVIGAVATIIAAYFTYKAATRK
jgi:hypothetical protein